MNDVTLRIHDITRCSGFLPGATNGPGSERLRPFASRLYISRLKDQLHRTGFTGYWRRGNLNVRRGISRGCMESKSSPAVIKHRPYVSPILVGRLNSEHFAIKGTHPFQIFYVKQGATQSH